MIDEHFRSGLIGSQTIHNPSLLSYQYDIFTLQNILLQLAFWKSQEFIQSARTVLYIIKNLFHLENYCIYKLPIQIFQNL